MADESAVQRWLDDGALNSENFFVDNDARPVTGSVPVSIGGVFTFRIALEAPHGCSVINPSPSAALAAFAASTAGPFPSVAAALSAAAAAYRRFVSDELEEDAWGDDGGGGDDDGYGDGYGYGDDDGGAAEAAEAATAAQAERRRKDREMTQRFEEMRARYEVGLLSKPTVERILSDYNNVLRVPKDGWDAAPEGRQLDVWSINVHGFDKGSQLEADMARLKESTGCGSIQMRMTFPADYPYRPPFLRVLRPRFVFRTGHVTVGGSICTKFLTAEGWQPVFDIESIIVSVRSLMLSPEAKAAVDFSQPADYDEAAALEAFQRVAEHHGRVGW